MADPDNIAIHIAHIDEKMDGIPEKIISAVALGVKPLCDTLIHHEERIGGLERSAKGLWAALSAGVLVLIGEIFYLWHTTASTGTMVIK